MRDDMHRVIITRPRILNGASRKGRLKPIEERPLKRGMRRDHSEKGSDKSLNDYLSPLRRYLAKQVGRPWDKVYSEIASKFGTRGPIHYHLRMHIFDFVAVTPRRHGTSWRDHDGRRRSAIQLWHQPFYVDERNGILKRTDMLPEEKARRRKIGSANAKSKQP
jgi:hypothetical protein